MILQIDRRTVRPVVTLPGDVQRAYEPSRLFDGATDRLDHANVFDPVGSPTTYSAWVFLSALAHTSYSFISHTNGDGDYATVLYIIVGGDLQFAVHGAEDMRKYGHAGDVPVGSWTHVAFTWLGTTPHTGVHLYTNGSELATYDDERNATGMIAATGSWSLGGRIYDDNRNLAGRLFWSCAHNAVLTPGEIAALGNRSNPTPPWEIRPESIVSMPNMRTLWDPYTRDRWTLDGTRPANPPWIWRPRQVSMYVPPTGLSIPIAMHHYKQLMGAN